LKWRIKKVDKIYGYNGKNFKVCGKDLKNIITIHKYWQTTLKQILYSFMPNKIAK
jgi:hypothetical protein